MSRQKLKCRIALKQKITKNNNLLTGIEPLRFQYRLAREGERVRLPSPRLHNVNSFTFYFVTFGFVKQHPLQVRLQGQESILFNPKFRLFFVQNWVLLCIDENTKRRAQLSRSSYQRFRSSFSFNLSFLRTSGAK